MKKTLLLLTACLLTIPVIHAQSFRFRASVDAVSQSGFHRIALPPNVVGRLNDDLTDVRLYDAQDREVPYRLTRQQPAQATPFAEYELISRQITPNVNTTLVIRKPGPTRINSLGVVMANTSVRKNARLSGSADAQTWYAIDNAIRLGPSPYSANTTDTQLLRFPLTDYAYYRLEISDSTSAPLNILRVGNYTSTALAGLYSPIPDVAVSQRDSSNQRSYVHLTRNTPARFDKLVLLVPTDTPYRRQAEVQQRITQRGKRGRPTSRFETIRTFELSSADSNVVYLPGLNTRDLYLVITNDDSPPLAVRTIRAYQLTTYLLANLTAGQTYHLNFSASNVPAPRYDQAPFQAGLSERLPIVGVNSLTNLTADEPGETLFFQDSCVIWLALGLVLVLIGFGSYRMLREMNKDAVR